MSQKPQTPATTAMPPRPPKSRRSAPGPTPRCVYPPPWSQHGARSPAGRWRGRTGSRSRRPSHRAAPRPAAPGPRSRGKAPVAGNGADDEADERQKADDAHGPGHLARGTRKLVRAPQAQHERQADDDEDVTQHLQRIERNRLEQGRCRGVQPAPEGKVQRHKHDGERVEIAVIDTDSATLPWPGA